jgi:hypothetical protein
VHTAKDPCPVYHGMTTGPITVYHVVCVSVYIHTHEYSRVNLGNANARNLFLNEISFCNCRSQKLTFAVFSSYGMLAMKNVAT